jgi:hypothetical protein
MHPYSVHLKRAEVVELLEEFADAVPLDPEELPQLAAIRRKLTNLIFSEGQGRA